MARRYRSARTRQFFRLSVFDRVVAHSAVGRRRGRATRPRLLRTSGRWAHRERRHAVAVPLPLGPAAGAAGEGRLAQSRYVRSVRRLRARGGWAARRPREALGDLQRAQCPRVVRTRARRPRPRPEGFAQHAGRHPPPEPGARPRRSSAACGARRPAPRHGDLVAAGAAVLGQRRQITARPNASTPCGTAPASIRW